MSIHKHVLWLTRTAVLIALLITLQFVTSLLGNQFVTGSIVNLILIVSLLTCGISTGLTVAIVSPLCAFLVGVGPAFLPIVPFIALGNAVLILVWFLIGLLNKTDKTSIRHKAIDYLIAVVAAVVKFLTLYTGIVKIAIPYILSLNEKQSAVLTLSFSYPQIVTAIIGGALALIVAPPIRKALASQAK